MFSSTYTYAAFDNTANQNTTNACTEKQPNELDNATTVSSINVSNNRATLEDIIVDADIETCEYLYSLDESPDYLYVELNNNGYAVFLSSTLELLEYSPTGRINFPVSASSKYYCGPGYYLIKANENKYENIITGKETIISEEAALEYSDNIRQMLTQSGKASNIYSIDGFDSVQAQIDEQNNEKNDAPSLSDNPHITNLDIGSGTYIDNFMYFLSDPQHGSNTSGTCGAVAAQLLLSYHNYYSDRRIIANNYLNGNSTTEREKNPNYCSNPMSMTKYTLGTRGIKEDGSDDSDSYFAKVVSEIHANAAILTVKNGIKDLLDENDIDYSIGWHTGFFFGAFPVSPDGIITEIDNGRPVIVGMSASLGGSDHWLVAYGYHDYTYPGTSETYSGYITHYGWGSGDINVWINSSWCDSYIELNINHNHNYDTYVGTFGSGGGVEYKCSICGHRTDKVINIADNTRYTERVISLEPYTFKDYYLKFSVVGNKVIQTFGTKDTRLYLYDSDMNLLEQDDDDGYSLNALISYNFAANTTYILRVKFYAGSNSGDIRLAVIPTYHHDNYESAYGPYKLTTVSWSLSNDRVALFRYKFDSAGTVTFTMSSSTNTDTYLYVIDPASTSMMTKYTGSNPGASNLYDDDSGSGLQAMLTKSVQANKEYLVIISFYNPHTMSGSFSINTSN